eukprot:10886761-Alexandrium_andersonii.AAC.1
MHAQPGQCMRAAGKCYTRRAPCPGGGHGDRHTKMPAEMMVSPSLSSGPSACVTYSIDSIRCSVRSVLGVRDI